jgi:hypothetical protein
LRRLYRFTRSEYLIEEGVLLLAAVRVTSFNFQWLFRTSCISFFVVADVSIRQTHLFLLFFIIFLQLNFSIFSHEIVLLMLDLTNFRVEMTLTTMLVTFCCIKTWFLNNLSSVKALTSGLNLRNCRILRLIFCSGGVI